ncbi:hypothetical protein ACFQZL_04875 [Myroides pelagicus]
MIHAIVQKRVMNLMRGLVLFILVLFLALVGLTIRDYMAGKPLEGLISSVFFMFTVLLVMFYYLLGYLNAFSIDGAILTKTNVFGQRKTFDLSVAETEIYIGTLYNKLSVKDGYIRITAKGNTLHIIEANYVNFKQLKAYLLNMGAN